MVRDIHADLKTAKNVLNDTDVWLVLFDLYVTDLEVLRLTNNEAEVTWSSNTYSPFPIGFDSLEETGEGDLPYISVYAANVDRVVSSYLETHSGLLDKRVTMHIINTSNNTAAISINLVIRETTATDNAVNFRLSHHPFLEISFPHQRYLRHRCRWKFKGTECGVDPAGFSGSGSTETCDKTLDGANGCAAHLNQARFGGAPGIPRRRI